MLSNVEEGARGGEEETTTVIYEKCNSVRCRAENVQENSLGLLVVQDGFNSTNAVSGGM